MKKFILLSITAFLFSASSRGAEEVTPSKSPKRSISSVSSYKERKGMNLAAFQLGGGFLLDSRDHVRGIAMFAWTPTYHFGSTVLARWSLGFTFRNAFKKDELRVADFSLTLIEKPKYNSPLFGELGAGVQYWTGNSARKFYPAAKAGFGYQFGDGEGFFKSFQLSYSYLFHEPLKTQQLLGVLTIGF